MLDIRRAARIIRAGGLVAFPTETVYGLGANALDPEAVRKIFALKGRPSNSPLIVHVDSIAMAQTLVTHWPTQADELTRRYWPGPLTMVLPKQAIVPDEVTAGLPTVAVRMPDHPVALALIHECALPLAAPSANRFTQLSPTTAAHVRAAFGDEIMILDGGPTAIGIESTVVSLAGPEPILLRPGIIPVEARSVSTFDESEAHPAPGLHRRHYSPRTPLVLVHDAMLPRNGRGAYIYRTQVAPSAHTVQMPADPKAYAAILYGTLHELDSEGFDWIAVENLPDTVEWSAIADRLRRAASYE
jgi:L-threonylcarbamoyladenylate synthase